MQTNYVLREIRAIYKEIQPSVKKRLGEFRGVWKDGSEEDIFCELVFCLMTPQSKAKSCGMAVDILKEHDLVFKGEAHQISEKINIVRFRNNKARYIIEAREMFTVNGKIKIKEILSSVKDIRERRDWLVKNVKGLGFKEASHFLRNTGFGDSIAILDRHILKNLLLLGVIDEIPKSLTSKAYHHIEDKLLRYSKKIKIPPDHLDMVLWYKEAGEIYK